jgi:hypothetical protein
MLSPILIKLIETSKNKKKVKLKEKVKPEEEEDAAEEEEAVEEEEEEVMVKRLEIFNCFL